MRPGGDDAGFARGVSIDTGKVRAVERRGGGSWSGTLRCCSYRMGDAGFRGGFGEKPEMFRASFGDVHDDGELNEMKVKQEETTGRLL